MVAYGNSAILLADNPTGTIGGNGCDATGPPGPGFVDIFYQIDFGVTTANTWTVTRIWGCCQWSLVLNVAPFTATWATSGTLNLTTCLGGAVREIDAGAGRPPLSLSFTDCDAHAWHLQRYVSAADHITTRRHGVD